MKKYGFLAIAALLIFSLSVSAQNANGKQRNKDGQRGNREMKWTAKDRAEMMDKQLDLTDAQVSQLQTLFEKQDAKRVGQREAMKAKREQGSVANRDKNREEMKSLREKEMQDFKTEVEGIIGKEKAEKWNTLQKEQWEKRRNSRQSK